ncbi:major facilitator superfamily domain-containing protein [Xylariales sp. PMI_506]|nr:major facilitator superfamily domain-containing protein [Xylariales sp. PMI_506]
MTSTTGSEDLVPAVHDDTAVITRAGTETDEKGIADISSQIIEESDQPKDFPFLWKATALICGIALSWGSSFSENTLGPLKATLLSELDIDNSQYGAIDSASSLVNTILPIIGGYGLDYYGVEWGSLACSTAIFIGATISAAGTNKDSFGLVLGGRIILGFGSTVIESCTSKILAHWFQHRGLGLVYGLDIAIGKLIVLIAKATAVPMRDASAFWGWALWIPAIVCFANLLQNIWYVRWSWSRPEWTHMPTGKKIANEEKNCMALDAENETPLAIDKGVSQWYSAIRSTFKVLAHVPRFFWLVVCSQTLQAGVVSAFSSLNADIIRTTRGSTQQIAGYTSSIQMVIPVVCSPMLGSFFDFFGYRMAFVSLTSAIWILVYSLIGFTQTNALGAMIIASVGTTMNALPLIASIPLMVPSQVELGLALGIWKAFNNSASVIVDMIAGRLQDITPGQTYERVIGFFVAIKGIEFCLGLFYGLLDRRYLGGILTMSEKKRMALEQKGQLMDIIGRKPAKGFTIFGLTLCASLIVIAWVLFIKFSI